MAQNISTEHIPPTPAQQRLVNIGMLLQFHLAALGHLAMWVGMFYGLLQSDPETNEAHVIIEAFVYTGLPISFGILVAVYIFFRCLLAYTDFGTALLVMISLNLLHAGIMGLAGLGLPLFFIVPIRLAIPIVLYSIACYFYYTHCSHTQMQARENEEVADAS